MNGERGTTNILLPPSLSLLILLWEGRVIIGGCSLEREIIQRERGMPQGESRTVFP